MASLLPEPADTCPDLRKEYEGKKIVLKNLEDGILGDLCGDEDDLKCTKVLVTSDGPSAVLQGTRFFFLGNSKIQNYLLLDPGWACTSCGGGINMTRLTNIQATSDR